MSLYLSIIFRNSSTAVNTFRIYQVSQIIVYEVLRDPLCTYHNESSAYSSIISGILSEGHKSRLPPAPHDYFYEVLLPAIAQSKSIANIPAEVYQHAAEEKAL